jgi:hypothetical protein
MKVKVLGSQKWNDTKIDLIQNCEYKYQTTGIWVDWFIPCGANGYPKVLNAFMDAIAGSVKRRQSARWFQLVGVIKGNQEIEHEIELGKKGTFTALKGGRLWVFANDADFAYWNNFGCLELDIEPNEESIQR